MREVAARVLSAAGYQVISGANGREGLELFRANAEGLDLVILDMTMPDLNGEEICPIMTRERQLLEAVGSILVG